MNARFAFAVLFAALSAAPALAACPASTTFFQSYAPTPTTASITATTYDYTFTDTWSAHTKFDRTQGTLSLSAFSGGRMTATLQVNECLDITGVPAGTGVDAFLDWELNGFGRENCGGSGCGVRMECTMTAGGGSVMADGNISGPGNFSRPIATTLTRPIHFVAGTPIAVSFKLDYGTGPGGGADAEVAGKYSVRGLPDGVRAIASSGGDVTPARKTTWGRLKTLYR